MIAREKYMIKLEWTKISSINQAKVKALVKITRNISSNSTNNSKGKVKENIKNLKKALLVKVSGVLTHQLDLVVGNRALLEMKNNLKISFQNSKIYLEWVVAVKEDKKVLINNKELNIEQMNNKMLNNLLKK